MSGWNGDGLLIVAMAEMVQFLKACIPLLLTLTLVSPMLVDQKSSRIEFWTNDAAVHCCLTGCGSQTLCHQIRSFASNKWRQEDHNANSRLRQGIPIPSYKTCPYTPARIYTAIIAWLRLRDHPLKPGDITGQVYKYLREEFLIRLVTRWWEPEIDQLVNHHVREFILWIVWYKCFTVKTMVE